MRKKKLRNIQKRRIAKECWSLDVAFIDWLNTRLKVYKHDASKIVKLDFHKFDYEGKEWTQIELIDKLIHLTDEIKNIDIPDEKYILLLNQACDIWKIILPAMWW